MQADNPKSTAKIGGHPIHPMLVNFPIAFLIGTLITDIVFAQSRNPFWADMSFYLLGAGIAMALLAAVAGLVDFINEARIRALRHAWQHMIGNLAAVLLAGTNFVMRFSDHDGRIVSLGLGLSVAVVGILAFTGWRGGDLVYRHGVGVKSSDKLMP